MSKQLEQFVKVSIPEPYTILGVTLRPLSLGHLILMKRFNCALGADQLDRSANLWDLFKAIAICSRKYQEFIEWWGNQEERDAWLTEWFTAIKKEVQENKQFNLLHKYSLFNIYRKDSVIVPMYFDESEGDEDGRESGAHWIQNVISLLLSKYEEAEILDMPLSKALFQYFKLLENKGDITFMADWQIEDFEKKEVKA